MTESLGYLNENRKFFKDNPAAILLLAGVLAVACLLLPSCAHVQKECGAAGGPAPRVERPLEYWRHPDVYLDNQADVLFSLIDETLQRNPATAHAPSPERRLVLASLDALLHDTRNDDSPALHRFVDVRVERIVESLVRPAPKKKLTVIKIYNDGYVVRSRSLTVGFDLCGTRGAVKIVPDSLMRRIVGACDMLFISHRDPDHADRNVVAMAHEAGIPVYGPADYDNAQVVPVREEFKEVKLASRYGDVSVLPLPGHQDDLQNNIYVVSFPEGFTVAHCGDQYNREDMPWLSCARERMPRQLDVMIINGWAMEMEETIRGFAPRMVISGHENEMGHGIDHREAFWLSQYKFDALSLPVPALVLAWAEPFVFER